MPERYGSWETVYPERLRQQFEGVTWRLKTGGQWREFPQEFGAVVSSATTCPGRSTSTCPDHTEEGTCRSGP